MSAVIAGGWHPGNGGGLMLLDCIIFSTLYFKGYCGFDKGA
jgi:hypothetical protein